ncbi:unnamed protein product [Prorocentrum cordatum]|uniref:Phospholipid-transporting ATPase n=1 Tax=Prorocentrum cordatum TaxID=2364126 RepID=A0ABN9T5X0_9DINO|nr:unnamed protein product [Polarella glacialis]
MVPTRTSEFDPSREGSKSRRLDLKRDTSADPAAAMRAGPAAAPPPVACPRAPPPPPEQAGGAGPPGPPREVRCRLESVPDVPGGCATVVPRLARQAMTAAGEANPPATEAAMPDRAFPAAAMLHEVLRVAATESPPWPRAEAALAARLSAVPALADRAAVVELAGELHMPPAQFVDDITVACPSIGAVRAVLSPEDESACSRYARTFKSFFSREKSKTCVLPVLGAPPPSLAGCPEVDRKVLLGILVDSDLTFYPFLREIVAVGHSCFSKLLYAAESGGFSIPVAAAQVPARVESVVLYAAPLLAAVPGAESTMNKLQVTWGRRLLGCHKGPPIRHAVVVAQCGWPMRLGTRFLEKALMARARLMVLPGDHQGALMLRAARSLATPTWESAVVALAQRLAPPPPDLEGHPLFPAALLNEARVSSAARKAILKSYRLEVLRPSLLRYDRAAYAKAAMPILAPFNRSFAALCTFPSPLDLDLLAGEPGPSFWSHYRLWAVARMTGKWPLSVMGGEEHPMHLRRCRACGSHRVSVRHALSACPVLDRERRELFPGDPAPDLLLQLLFGDTTCSITRIQHVGFAGRAIRRSLGSRCPARWRSAWSAGVPSEDEPAVQPVASAASCESDGLAAEPGGPSWEPEDWAHEVLLAAGGAQVWPPAAAARTNAVRTARFTLLSWLPKSLLLQLRRAANAWALLIGVLAAALGDDSPQAPGLILTILSIILLWTSGRELSDDLGRQRDDLASNSWPTQRLSTDHGGDPPQFCEVERQDCRLGDVLLLRGGQMVPADLLLVACSGTQGTCYVSTSSLDGERHLKQRTVPGALRSCGAMAGGTAEAAAACVLEARALVRLQAPCVDLSTVGCSIMVGDAVQRVDCGSFLLRGSRVDATDWAVGAVCYVGGQTKARLNAIAVQSKVSYMQRKLNYFIVCTLVGIVALSTAWSILEQFALEDTFDFGQMIVRLAQYLIILYPVVPLTMYVNYEVLQLALVRGLHKDEEMHGLQSREPVEVRTSDLIEELGQVDYVFSDKTGTLTQNDMRFAACCIGSGAPMTALEAQLVTKGGALALDGVAAAFFETLATCHTVQLSSDGHYQGESPDEVALVQAAADLGFVLSSREETGTGSLLRLQTPGGARCARVAEVLAFTSDRRRMSVVCPDHERGGATVLTKGADSAVEPLLARPLPTATRQALEGFARRGLRTLVLGRGRVPEATYAGWRRRWARADASMRGREAKLAALALAVEVNLELVGVTAVEDRLQEGVGDTLVALRRAGIRAWVLTGDKVSTAVEISHACGLFDERTSVVRIVATASADHTTQLLRVALANARALRASDQPLSLGLVLDGQAAQHAMEHGEVRELLYQLGRLCNACVACRMSPRQKEQLVRLVAQESRSRERRQSVVLAIGDGANDVPMIQAADVGVGLRGREGTQAVQASDVAVSDFRCLRRLLLCHGRDSYRILALFICWFLYKNLLLAWATILYAPGSSYQGAPAYPPSLVNCPIWTFIVLPVFATDKDDDYCTSLEHPELYKLGTQRTYFNFWVVTGWMLLASLHGIIAWVVPMYSLTDEEDRQQQSPAFWKASLTAFTVQLTMANLTLLMSLAKPVRKSALAPVAGAMIAYVIFLFLVSYPLRFIDRSVAGLAPDVFVSWRHLLCMLLLPPVVILMDLAAVGLKAMASRAYQERGELPSAKSCGAQCFEAFMRLRSVRLEVQTDSQTVSSP